MNSRLQSLDSHFLRTTSWNSGTSPDPTQTEKLKKQGRFVDAWSYLNCDEFLSADAIKMKQQVCDFMTRVNPTLYPFHESSTFPHHLIPEIAALGVVGADFAKPVGKGFSMMEMGSLMYEFARRDASIATFFLLHHSLGNYTVQKLA
jgi:glutaryl-CoA dehydrogenase